MTIIVERILSTWFDRLTMTGHPELVEGYRDVCVNNYVVMYKIRRKLKFQEATIEAKFFKEYKWEWLGQSYSLTQFSKEETAY
jgi:hypothetical protein